MRAQKKRRGDEQVEQNFVEYQALLAQGKTHEEAIAEFSHLHSIGMSRLMKRIKNSGSQGAAPAASAG